MVRYDIRTIGLTSDKYDYVQKLNCKKYNKKKLIHVFVVVQSAKLNNLHFYPLEVVSRYRDPQLQVGKNYSYSFDLRSNICKSWCFNVHFISNNNDLTR